MTVRRRLAAAVGILALALAVVMSGMTWREQPRASASQRKVSGSLRLSPDVAEPGSRISARGRVVPRVERRVVLQRAVGRSWKPVASGTSAGSGRYTLVTRLPRAESTLVRYRVRVPRWTVRGRVLSRRITPIAIVRTTSTTPAPSPTPTPNPSPTPIPTPTPSPTPTPIPTPTPSPTSPPALPALSAGQVVVAYWPMDEPAGSTTMVDGSGSGHPGSISANAAAAGLVLRGSDYAWSSRCRDCPPVALPRLVQVADSADLDIPDPSVPWMVEFRFSTNTSHGNIMQKGQAVTRGGQIKVEDASGLRCVFRGADGSVVVATGTRRLDDEAWHTVACVHTATSVSQYVDGVLVARTAGRTGPIDNGDPFVLGGKRLCDQRAVGCDYYSGAIDWVRVVHG
ncbi:LamG-like jellyroll fold domain-containing protein [Nocardioides sp. P5_C9_2]